MSEKSAEDKSVKEEPSSDEIESYATKHLGFDMRHSCSTWIAREALMSKYPQEELSSRTLFFKMLNEDVLKLTEKENFSGLQLFETLTKLMKSQCSIKGCENVTDFLIYAPHEPPLFCLAHIDDGEGTHYGEYLPTSTYYHHWTCCGNSWRKSHCIKTGELYRRYSPFIPILPRQLESLAERTEAARIRQAEEESYNRRMGYDECYDRY